MAYTRRTVVHNFGWGLYTRVVIEEISDSPIPVNTYPQLPPQHDTYTVYPLPPGPRAFERTPGIEYRECPHCRGAGCQMCEGYGYFAPPVSGWRTVGR